MVLNLKPNTRLAFGLISLRYFPPLQNFVGCRFRRHTTALQCQIPLASSIPSPALQHMRMRSPENGELEKKRRNNKKEKVLGVCVCVCGVVVRQTDPVRPDAAVRSVRAVYCGSTDLLECVWPSGPYATPFSLALFFPPQLGIDFFVVWSLWCFI